MNRLLFLLCTLTTVFTPIHADRYTDLAQHIYDWLKAGQADSLLAHSSEKVKTSLPPQMVKTLWTQLLTQGGTLQEEQPWTQMQTQGYEVRQRVLVFERTALRLNVVFSQGMQMEGITFTPAPVPERPATKDTAQVSEEGFTERPFAVKHGKIELPGTLTLPTKSTGRLPAVVLVQGSGASDRNETVGANKPFRDLAHSLARRGIAVLRYDKRTFVYGARTAEVSDGKLDYHTEMTDDAAAAMKLLSEVAEVDARRVFVLGHSLGGTVLPLIAETAEVKPAGLIGMAALARPFWEAVESQLQYTLAPTAGASASPDSLVSQTIQQIRKSLPEEYLDFIDQYKPLEEVAKLKGMPMLFVQGGHDYQVTEADLHLWETALKGNKQAEFRFFPTLDHLLRPLSHKAVPDDYLKAIPQSEEAVNAIADFILKH